MTIADPCHLRSSNYGKTQERPLKNALFCHSGLDPESRKLLKALDSGFRRNDDMDAETVFFKGL